MLLDGGHKPQPSMVSLDPPAHGRLRKPGRARVHAAARRPRWSRASARRVDELLDAVDAVAAVRPRRRADVPAAGDDHVQLHGRARARTGRSSRSGAAAARASPGAGRRPRSRSTTRRNMVPTAATCASSWPRKADDRADDFASALLEIHDEDPDALTHEEIASILFSLSFAGHETTNYLIGNCVRRLLEDRERWEAVVARPGADPRRGRRDAALRPVGAGVAAGDHAAGDARRRRAARRARSCSSGSPRRPRRRRLPRPRPLRPRARERPPHARVRQGHPLLPRRRLGKLEARSRSRS